MGLQTVPADERLRLSLPGGAGYGDPFERPARELPEELARRSVLEDPGVERLDPLRHDGEDSRARRGVPVTWAVLPGASKGPGRFLGARAANPCDGARPGRTSDRAVR